MEGYYYDPNHGGCLRRVAKIAGRTDTYRIIGAYGDDEQPHQAGETWTATMRAQNEHLTIDFDGKFVTHERLYRALWCPCKRVIRWQDGNTWYRMYSMRHS